MAEFTTTEVETTGAEVAPDVHPLVGLPDGHVDQNGETITYVYDDEGSFVGWHKLPAKDAE